MKGINFNRLQQEPYTKAGKEGWAIAWNAVTCSLYLDESICVSWLLLLLLADYLYVVAF
jgi:hypothetical protein